MKAYTDLEQSKKLAEILPLESADMVWVLANPDLPMIKAIAYEDSEKSKYYEVQPAWSFAALLNILPNYQLQTQEDGIGILCSCNGKFNIVTADNPINACCEMILKLHESNLL